MADSRAQLESRFLVLAPTGRDASLTCELMHKADLWAQACGDMAELCQRAEQEGAAGLMIAEEALAPSAIRRLQEVLARQPSWSDLPILIFTARSASARMRPSSEQLLATLGNVTLLDRPLRPISMVSAARSALRARQRQYAARAELHEQQRAVRGRDEFLAMLGHELRNPLSAITMALELDRSEPPSKYRDIVRRQARHLARLVDDLLDVSRVTRGLVALSRAPVDLRDVVAEAIEQSRPLIDARRHTLQAALGERPLTVDGDRTRLVQVVTNLLNNAAKYTPDGGFVDVALNADDGASEAVLTVRDNGSGIGPDLLPVVFDLFTQGSRTLDRTQGGLGLGLALVRKLVELHGGSVAVSSTGAGAGSTFTVRLPLL